MGANPLIGPGRPKAEWRGLAESGLSAIGGLAKEADIRTGLLH
jgi:hypothetical protein